MSPRSKPEGFEEPEYLAWVSKIPCCACSPHVLEDPHRHVELVRVSDPHHVFDADKAMNRKPPDAFAIPLCRECHDRRFQPLGRYVPGGRSARSFATIEDFALAWYAVAKLRWAWEREAPSYAM
jgi:hypothetical protein